MPYPLMVLVKEKAEMTIGSLYHESIIVHLVQLQAVHSLISGEPAEFGP